jgi:DNA-binding transcriptional regulator WhiA
MGIETISRQDCTLNKELAYIIGVYLTDGSITGKNFQLQAIDMDFVEKTLEYLSKMVNTRAHIRKRVETSGWNVSPRYVIKVGINSLADWLINETNNKHHIPMCILNGNDGIKKWFIAGVMDGDGFITKTKRPHNPEKFQYRIGIGGVADGWIYEFRQLLCDMRVKCNKIERFTTKNGRWFCRFTVNPQTFFDAKLFFTIKRKRDRCTIASETIR